jgi:K+-transporting ATPase ATPase B chain
VIAKSGKAVEVAGDIDVLLLDKTGTITYGDRQATAFYPLAGVTESELRQAAVLTSFADPTPEGKSVVVLAKEQGESIVNLNRLNLSLLMLQHAFQVLI